MFEDNRIPDYIYKFNKAIYCLKQALGAWFDKLKASLVQFGFHASKVDASLFKRVTSSSIVCFLVYVDNIVLIGLICLKSNQSLQIYMQNLHLKTLVILTTFFALMFNV